MKSVELRPIDKGEQLLKHFMETSLCRKCKNTHPREMPDCPFCEQNYMQTGLEPYEKRGGISSAE